MLQLFDQGKFLQNRQILIFLTSVGYIDGTTLGLSLEY